MCLNRSTIAISDVENRSTMSLFLSPLLFSLFIILFIYFSLPFLAGASLRARVGGRKAEEKRRYLREETSGVINF